MLTRFTLLSLLCISSLLAQPNNNHTIILASNSTFNYAKASLKKLSLHTKNNPIFILKSKSGYFMTTTGMYNSKSDIRHAIKTLPTKLQNIKPFASTLNYDLTSDDARILYSKHLDTTIISVQKVENTTLYSVDDNEQKVIDSEKKLNYMEQMAKSY